MLKDYLKSLWPGAAAAALGLLLLLPPCDFAPFRSLPGTALAAQAAQPKKEPKKQPAKAAPAKTPAKTPVKTAPSKAAPAKTPAKPTAKPVPAKVKPAPAKAAPAKAAAAPQRKVIRAEWAPLVNKLRKDGLYNKQVEGWFLRLEAPYSQRPMGGKIRGLFLARYRPFRFLRRPVEAPPMLPDVFTPGNVQKCAAYLKEHAGIFNAAEKALKVDKEVVVALLMVETKLGTYLGREPAFWSLACMSVADKPDKVGDHLKDLRITPARQAWIDETLVKRSEWAYKEFKALIQYSVKHKHDPLAIHGSPWGAIGYCQFMPSNISAYALDGDKDGRIDLFNEADAIFSTANYIKKHGWKPGIDRDKKHAIVRRYNHSTPYANTVLALAEAVAEARVRADGKRP